MGQINLDEWRKAAKAISENAQKLSKRLCEVLEVPQGTDCEEAKKIQFEPTVFYEHKQDLPKPEVDWYKLRVAQVGEPLAMLERIADNIGGGDVTDDKLEEWAKHLVIAINESNGIDEELRGMTDYILKKETDCYTRIHNGYKVVHNKLMLARWYNLRLFVCREFPQFSYVVAEPQVTEAKAVFRMKYGSYIKEVDTFLMRLPTIKGKGIKEIYEKIPAKYHITLKEFVDDCLRIIPERANERGMNYEAIKKIML